MSVSWYEYADGQIASEDRLTEAIAARMRDNVGRFASEKGHSFGCELCSRPPGGTERQRKRNTVLISSFP